MCSQTNPIIQIHTKIILNLRIKFGIVDCGVVFSKNKKNTLKLVKDGLDFVLGERMFHKRMVLGKKSACWLQSGQSMKKE